jgi:hypothetical protein
MTGTVKNALLEVPSGFTRTRLGHRIVEDAPETVLFQAHGLGNEAVAKTMA